MKKNTLNSFCDLSPGNGHQHAAAVENPENSAISGISLHFCSSRIQQILGYAFIIQWSFQWSKEAKEDFSSSNSESAFERLSISKNKIQIQHSAVERVTVSNFLKQLSAFTYYVFTPKRESKEMVMTKLTKMAKNEHDEKDDKDVKNDKDIAHQWRSGKSRSVEHVTRWSGCCLVGKRSELPDY